MTTDTTPTVEIPPRLDLGRHVAGPVFQAMLRFSQAAEEQGLERSLVELVKIRASQINGCAYCLRPQP
jgi:alkylhydroperoxidase family enzyme